MCISWYAQFPGSVLPMFHCPLAWHQMQPNHRARVRSGLKTIPSWVQIINVFLYPQWLSFTISYGSWIGGRTLGMRQLFHQIPNKQIMRIVFLIMAIGRSEKGQQQKFQRDMWHAVLQINSICSVSTTKSVCQLITYSRMCKFVYYQIQGWISQTARHWRWSRPFMHKSACIIHGPYATWN